MTLIIPTLTDRERADRLADELRMLAHGIDTGWHDEHGVACPTPWDYPDSPFWIDTITRWEHSSTSPQPDPNNEPPY
jgi:hypothetical protein